MAGQLHPPCQDMRVKKRRRRYRDDAAESHTAGDLQYLTIAILSVSPQGK